MTHLLGGVQAFLGWYMVQSGLDTQPVVSHLRLGVHLVVAFLLFSLLWIMALNLHSRTITSTRNSIS